MVPQRTLPSFHFPAVREAKMKAMHQNAYGHANLLHREGPPNASRRAEQKRYESLRVKSLSLSARAVEPALGIKRIRILKVSGVALQAVRMQHGARPLRNEPAQLRNGSALRCSHWRTSPPRQYCQSHWVVIVPLRSELEVAAAVFLDY